MKVIDTPIADLKIIEPVVHGDDRGFFYESFNKQHFEQLTGQSIDFVQDNHSRSRRGVLRGLHYQHPYPQGKLVRVALGDIFDVAVDMRHSSPSFGQTFGVHLSATNKRQLWVPEGFAHGFLTLSDFAELLYKTTDYYHPEHEHCLLWNDSQLAIQWPLAGLIPQLSAKDALGKPFAQATYFA